MVIGDIKGIRKDNNLGHVTNQKLYSLPYDNLYAMLEYKLSIEGITLVKQEESYSSQVSPLKASVTKANAKKSNRIHRSLYKDGGYAWNADCVGAFNILRKYLKSVKSDIVLPCDSIKVPLYRKSSCVKAVLVSWTHPESTKRKLLHIRCSVIQLPSSSLGS